MHRTPTSVRRAVAKGLGALLMVAAVAGCTPLPPPAAPPAPTVVSADVTPVVEAGTPVTALLRTIHPAGVDALNLSVRGANGARFDATDDPGDCPTRNELRVPVVRQPEVEAEVSASCTMPAHASNGTWILTVRVTASGYQGAVVTLPFEVVGGVDDLGPPVVTMLTPTAAVVAGTSFELKLRVEDVNLRPDTDTHALVFQRPMVGNSRPPGSFNCHDRVRTWVAPTVLETTMRCDLPAGLPPGTYVGAFYAITDLLGLNTEIAPEIVVVAA